MKDIRNTVNKIYLDMDGVLADFDRGVRELCGMEPQPQNGKRSAVLDDLMWEAVRKADHFYDRLKLIPGAEDLFREIRREYGERCEVLTGIPKPHRGILTAGEDKINWMHRVLCPEIKVHIVLREEKLNFCTGPETVLIDDREKTIRDWKEKGGTGFLCRSPLKTLDDLRDEGVLVFSRFPD